MSNHEKLHTGELYICGAPELLKDQLRYQEILYDFNHTRPSEGERRATLLKEMLAECGEDCYIEPPFHANWGGHHVHFGKGIFANFNLTAVDDTHIYVGDYTQFGPNVVLATAGHPLNAELRDKGYQYNAPIRIGKSCWLGSGVLVMPGVSIGDGSVIGAGSVVTHDIPPNSLAMGIPCRVVRELDERDRKYYFKDREIDGALWE